LPGIAVVGSLNADLVVHVERAPRPGETVLATGLERFPGGKGGNQACAAARLGAPTRMYGRVGADANGAWLRDQLTAAGVDVGSVIVDNALPTGLAIITIDGRGENQIVVVAGANGACDPAIGPGERTAFGAVLLQLEIPLDVVTRTAIDARHAGQIVVLDPAPARPLPPALIESVSYLTPNDIELSAMTGGGSVASRADARGRAQTLIAHGARHVLVKLGDRGALLVAPDREIYWPAFDVAVADTTAAGDAFNAAFAVALLETGDEERAGLFATAAAAVAVTRAGAQPAMPTRAEVEALLENGSRRRPFE
jgi:ribokinase